MQNYAQWQATAPSTTANRTYHIFLLAKGSGKFMYEFNTHLFKAPCALFFAAYQPFKIQADEETAGTVIQFATDFFCIDHHHSEVSCQGLLFNNVYESPMIEVQGSIDTELTDVVRKIELEFEQQEQADAELVSTYIKVFLKIAVRAKKQQLSTLAIQQNLTDKPMLTRLRTLIELHYRETKSPSDYADKLNISTKALGKLVKENFGRTLTDMIQERVVYEAKHQLFTTDKSIKEIADYLGYEDPYYFSRLFKNVTSVSPEKYRQTIYYS